MKLLKTILLLSIFQVSIYALPDSVLIKINSLPDTSKFDKLSEIAWKNRFQDPVFAAKASHKAIEIATNLKDFNRLAKINNIQGIIYLYQGDLINSQKFINDALKFAQIVDNIKEIGYSYNNFGSLQGFQNNNEQALVYFKKALNVLKQTKDNIAIAYAYIRISDAFREIGENDSSIHYAKLAYDNRLIAGDTADANRALLNIGLAYESMRDFDKAIEYFDKVKDFIYDPGRIETFLGRTYLEKGELHNAIKFAELALTLVKNMYSNNKINYEVLHKAYELKGDYKKAYYYLSLKNQLLEDIDTEDKKKQLEFLKFAYNLKYAEDENDRLISEAKYKDIQIIYSVIGLSILLLLAIFLIIVLIKFNKNNRLLAQKNQETMAQSDELKVLNGTKDKFFSIIAHDLRNPIGSIKSAFNFINDNYDEFSKEELHEFVKSMSDSSNKVYALLENLLEWSKIQREGVKIDLIHVDLNLVINDNIKLLSQQAQNKKIKILNEINESLIIFADINMVNTIFRNLISNSIKFSHQDGIVKIYKLYETKEYVEIVVEDNGIGISNDILSKLFQIDKNVNTVGTNNETGTGLGLILCKEFIDINGGSIRVESIENKFTKFFLKFLKNE